MKGQHEKGGRSCALKYEYMEQEGDQAFNGALNYCEENENMIENG